VHDTAPFVLLPFYNPEVEECPVQRPNRDCTARGWSSALTPTTPDVRCADKQSDAAILAMAVILRFGSTHRRRADRRAPRSVPSAARSAVSAAGPRSASAWLAFSRWANSCA